MTWQAFKQEELGQQVEIEEQVLTLYQQDQAAAAELLTHYTTERARQAVAVARQLVERIKQGERT